MTTQTKIADPLTVRGRIQHYKTEFPAHYEFPPRKDKEPETDYLKRKQRTRGAMNGNFSKILKGVIAAYPDEKKVDLSDRVALYRRLILSWVLTPDDDIFEDRSSAEYLDADWFGISKWQGSHFDDDLQAWKLRDGFHDEVLQILHCAKEDYAFVLKGEHPISMNDVQNNWVKVLKEEPVAERMAFIQATFEEVQQEQKSGLFVPEPIQNEPLEHFQAPCEVVLIENEPFPFTQITEAVSAEEYDPFGLE